jgi:hypothetical protein
MFIILNRVVDHRTEAGGTRDVVVAGGGAGDIMSVGRPIYRTLWGGGALGPELGRWDSMDRNFGVYYSVPWGSWARL